MTDSLPKERLDELASLADGATAERDALAAKIEQVRAHLQGIEDEIGEGNPINSDILGAIRAIINPTGEGEHDANKAITAIDGVLDTVLDVHRDEVGSHWHDCWKHHAGCLAAKLKENRNIARVLVAANLVEHDRAVAVKALNEAADAWSQGAWSEAPRRAERAADRLAVAQFAGDWLRSRAKQQIKEEA